MPPSVPAPPDEDLPRPLRAAGGFRNPGRHDDRGWLDVLRWKLAARAAPWPGFPAARPLPPPPAPSLGFTVTAIGHATFLVRTPAFTLLTDPVWSERVGPFGLVGPRRARPAAVPIDSLPPIDAILLSHDHYDHCDLPTLRHLARAHPRARLLTPLAHADLARRAGFGPERHRELDWWENTELPAPAPPAPGASRPASRPLLVSATPARHWSNRLSGTRNQRLWSGWHLSTPEASLLFTGDTAYDPSFFPAIRRRLGPPDLAIIPIGAYAPRWFMREQHCDPEEAVRILLDLGAKRGLGMHWGVFPLTDEPRDEPAARLAAAARAAGLRPDRFLAAEPGLAVSLPDPAATTPPSASRDR